MVVLAAGGSARAARAVIGMFPSKMGFPDLFVLDSCDPAAVRHTRDSIAPARTLFVVSTKSGTTADTLALYAYFRGRVEGAGPKPGLDFVALTDPGTPLEELAADVGFPADLPELPVHRQTLSALSFFGLLPAALVGVDVRPWSADPGHGRALRQWRGRENNPGVRLGAALAGLARAGRDKVTLVMSDAIRVSDR